MLLLGCIWFLFVLALAVPDSTGGPTSPVALNKFGEYPGRLRITFSRLSSLRAGLHVAQPHPASTETTRTVVIDVGILTHRLQLRLWPPSFLRSSLEFDPFLVAFSWFCFGSPQPSSIPLLKLKGRAFFSQALTALHFLT